jgi:O-antigen biosynthesis protein WbqP
VYRYVKRGIDCLLALLSAVLLAPVFLLLIAAIKMDSAGPVFFRQRRVGIHKTYFFILKFRTMRRDTPKDTPTHMLKNPEGYITRVGRVLRKTSLDELPQVFNILIGSMSFVGPRPALWNQTDLIMERDKYGANDIRPGLTGWAQINGRDELPIEVKAMLDGFYVERMSFLFDCKCFFKTIANVITRAGVREGVKEEVCKQKE